MGIGAFLNGLGYLFGKIPLQGRKERWRNEIAKLEREKDTLISKGACEKNANRLAHILNRIDYLNQLLRNADGN